MDVIGLRIDCTGDDGIENSAEVSPDGLTYNGFSVCLYVPVTPSLKPVVVYIDRFHF